MKDEFTIKDYQNQIPYAAKELKSDNLPIYQTNNSLVSLAQQDVEKFSNYGVGLSSILGEVGSMEFPAVDKLQTVFILARGGELPDIDEDFDSK